MISRKITNDDLWSAIRGIGMYRMTRGELTDLIARHNKIPAFASRVIVEAAQQTEKLHTLLARKNP